MSFLLRSRFIKKIILFFSTFFLFNLANAQHNYYFNSKTLSEGNGTKEQPFKSLEKLTQLTFQPDDTVSFHNGDTLNGNIILNNINGTKKTSCCFHFIWKCKRKMCY